METEGTRYKGYTIVPTGIERQANGLVRVYMIYNRDGNGVARAWGMTEAKALVNADIRGELRWMHMRRWIGGTHEDMLQRYGSAVKRWRGQIGESGDGYCHRKQRE